jgi:hypothetical protein
MLAGARTPCTPIPPCTPIQCSTGDNAAKETATASHGATEHPPHPTKSLPMHLIASCKRRATERPPAAPPAAPPSPSEPTELHKSRPCSSCCCMGIISHTHGASQHGAWLLTAPPPAGPPPPPRCRPPHEGCGPATAWPLPQTSPAPAAAGAQAGQDVSMLAGRWVVDDRPVDTPGDLA